MMRFLTMEMIKAHTRIDNDIEDVMLGVYGQSAEDLVLHNLNRSLEDLLEEYGNVPAPIIHAALMLVDWSYENRKPVSDRNMWEIPYTYTALIKPYMRL